VLSFSLAFLLSSKNCVQRQLYSLLLHQVEWFQSPSYKSNWLFLIAIVKLPQLPPQ
jgi:hypothetical protein